MILPKVLTEFRTCRLLDDRLMKTIVQWMQWSIFILINNIMGTKNFSIKVANFDGDPCQGVKVSVSGTGIVTSYFQTEYTDRSGWANFQYDYVFDYSLEVDIEINGDHVGRHSFTYDDSTSFTIDWN